MRIFGVKQKIVDHLTDTMKYDNILHQVFINIPKST